MTTVLSSVACHSRVRVSGEVQHGRHLVAYGNGSNRNLNPKTLTPRRPKTRTPRRPKTRTPRSPKTLTPQRHTESIAAPKLENSSPAAEVNLPPCSVDAPAEWLSVPEWSGRCGCVLAAVGGPRGRWRSQRACMRTSGLEWRRNKQSTEVAARTCGPDMRHGHASRTRGPDMRHGTLTTNNTSRIC